MFPTKKSPKISYKFFCEKCDYKCNKNSEFNKHILTDKHKILQNPTSSNDTAKQYMCNCGKKYKHSSTLYAHKKKCENFNCNTIETTDEMMLSKDFLMTIIHQNTEIIKENNELKHMLLDNQTQMIKVIETGTHNTIMNSNNNSNNKAFNLNVFLE